VPVLSGWFFWCALFAHGQTRYCTSASLSSSNARFIAVMRICGSVWFRVAGAARIETS
jgi:hypothetical protein